MKGAAPGEGRSLIFWKYKLEKYQGVIGARNPGYKHHLDAARFADTLKSAGFDARLRVE